jgi:glycoprotein-N-acetylgalactosamine 3-beta-galactosyltransferase
MKWIARNSLVHGKFVTLKNVASGRCLQVGKTLAGGIKTPLEIVACTASCAQLWWLGISQTTPFPPTHALDHRGGTISTPLPRSKDRIFCWVLTHPRSHSTRAKAVMETWGRECDYLVFATSQTDPSLPTLVVNISGPDTRDALWTKTKTAWMHAYRTHLDKAEWFCKFDDDTLVIMPHLREFLHGRRPADVHYFGRRLHFGGGDDERLAYYSGGAGHVLSRGALQKLGAAIISGAVAWAGPWDAPEDYALGQTLHAIGIHTVDTRDQSGAHRFLTLGIGTEVVAERSQKDVTWYWSFSRDAREGPDCCSRRWITSHYEPVEAFYAISEMKASGCTADQKRWPYLDTL